MKSKKILRLAAMTALLFCTAGCMSVPGQMENTTESGAQGYPAASAGSAVSLSLVLLIVLLLLYIGLGFIPANIAKKKGYSFGLFWLFGFFFFVPALIVSLCISDKNAPQQYFQPPVPVSRAEELKKYSELHEQGVITDEEFIKIKEKLLN